MARLVHPYKVHPDRTRAWTMEETRIPHRPNSSASRPPRRDFQIPVVVNPAFQQQFNEPSDSVHEEDMEPTLMEAPQAQGPRRVTKRENINVIRECEWDVKDLKDETVGRRTPLNRPLVALLIVVCITSMLSLLLTFLILSGLVGSRNCSCDGGAGFGSTSAQTSEDDRIEKVSENITTLGKKMGERIEQLEELIPNKESFREEMVELINTLLNNRTAKLQEQITSQERIITNLTRRLESTELELKKVEAALVGQIDGLWNVTKSTAGQLGELKNIWEAVNATTEETANLTIKVEQQFGNVWRGVNESKVSLLANMTSKLKDLQTKVNMELENVRFNLNKTRKCCNNLTLSLDSFKTNVANRSQRLEARIEVEEQKSNSTRQKTELHFKKTQYLENLLNITRQDIKNVSRQHSTALSLAENFSKREFHGVWNALNSTKSDLLGEIQKVTENLTEQLNQTQEQLHSSDAFLFASFIHLNTSITEKVNNVSKMAGPIGPPGLNGSEGPAGPSGAIGPPGPKGAGDFSLCKYDVKPGTMTPGNTNAMASFTETNGKKIMGATCSTNFAEEYNLKSRKRAGKWTYVCDCRGDSAEFSPGGGEAKTCYLHYWECPLTT